MLKSDSSENAECHAICIRHHPGSLNRLFLVSCHFIIPEWDMPILSTSFTREYESAKKFDLKPIIVPLWFGQVSFDEITVRVRYLSRCLYKLALLSCVSQQCHIFSLVLKRY